MSNTIADKLVVLSDGLELIDQERQYQTDLILNLQDSLERLSTPIPQSAPLITIDDTTGIVTASVTQEQGGYIAPGTLQTQVEAKYHSQNLRPQNIKSGVKILGVTGTMSSGIDTSDATAKAEYLRKGTTAYVNGQKITGTAEESEYFDLNNITPGSTEIDVYPRLDSEKTYWISGRTVPSITVPLEAFGDATAANVRKNKTFTSSSGYSVTGTMPDVAHVKPSISINAANGIVTASHTTVAGYTDAGTTSNTLQLSVQGATTITPSALEQTAVAAGFYTKGAVKVAGDIDLQAANIRNGVSIFNVTGTYTSDATADATHILRDKIAYSKGSKITGTMANNGSWSCTGINAGAEYTIPAGYHTGRGKVIANSLSGQTQATATAANIAEGKTAWVNGTKITGTMTDHGAVAMALALGGTYKIPAGYHNGSGKVTTQSLSSQTPGTAAAADIVKGKTAWVSGSKVTGTMPTINSIIKQASAKFDGDRDILYTATLTDKGYLNGNTPITLGVEVSDFGNATADQVLSGKTFTSSAGFKATGTVKNMDDNWISLDSFDYDGDVNVQGVLNQAMYIPKGGTLKAYVQSVDLEGSMLWHYLPLLIQGNQPWGVLHSDGHDDEYVAEDGHAWYDGFEHIVDDYGYDPYYWWDISITDSSSSLDMSAYNDNPRLTLHILVRNSVSWIDGIGGQSDYAHLYNTLTVPPQEEVTFSESYDMLKDGTSIDWEHTIIGWRWTKE